MKLDELRYEQFVPLVGTSFWAEFPNGAKVELRVDEVLKVMESEAARLSRTAFTIRFSGPLSFHLRQGIYQLRHEAFPEPMGLFMVPIGQTAESYNYEVVFT
ncbi:MAG TPA: hypothetical protein VF846_18120 [Thermoanaerobaculia bacterium]